MSVRANAQFVRQLADEHGSAGRFFADWPVEDHIGLLAVLDKRGNRLGGMSGQYILRAIGRDSFVMSHDVLVCLRPLRFADLGGEADQEGPQADPGSVQCLGRRDGPAANLSLAHLRLLCGHAGGRGRALIDLTGRMILDRPRE